MRSANFFFVATLLATASARPHNGSLHRRDTCAAPKIRTTLVEVTVTRGQTDSASSPGETEVADAPGSPDAAPSPEFQTLSPDEDDESEAKETGYEHWSTLTAVTNIMTMTMSDGATITLSPGDKVGDLYPDASAITTIVTGSTSTELETNDSTYFFTDPADVSSHIENLPSSVAESWRSAQEDEEPSPTADASEVEASSSAPASTSDEEPAPTETDFARAYPADVVDELQDESMADLKEFLGKRSSGSCTLENAAVRREWSDLSLNERRDYIESVQCLQSLPPVTPSSVAAGAKSRFDDFLVTHIQQTTTVHNTANFLSWHRYFTWTYEQALREECGYKGYQPYWNWDRYAADPANSPLFNGNETSLGGNSVNGGCVESGPFSDLTVTLGPGASLGDNPRCLKRDISKDNAARTTADKTFSLITGSNDIGTFQDRFQDPSGIHAAGHFTIGGDPGGDIYSSPGDPAFYLHHAMVDRVWWIWQLQDLETRLSAVAGITGGWGNGGARGTLQDDVNLGYVGDGVALGTLLDTMGGKGGEFCYIYV